MNRIQNENDELNNCVKEESKQIMKEEPVAPNNTHNISFNNDP